MPGVSIIHPEFSLPEVVPSSGSAIALEDVWRPRPVLSLTIPVARSAAGIN